MRFTLVVEAVDAIDGWAFMVAPEQEEVAWVLHLVGHEQTDGLKWELAAIYIISEEEVIGLGRVFAVVEQSEQIGVLSMNVAFHKTKRTTYF